MHNRNLSRWVACALLVLLTPGAWGEEPWQHLPPMPSLPPNSVGEHYTVDGAHIWYAEWNPHASGVPVLLLHGGYGNSSYFGNLIPVLVQHGYRVIAMDSRGHGRSTAPGEQITYHLMASDVIGLLDHLKVSKVNLVGWSDGGIIGFDLAINHPERLNRLFAFGVDADVSGLKDGFDKNPVFAAYLARVKDEYRSLSPTPERWDAFNANVNKMWETLPAYTAEQLRSIRVPTTIADGEYDEGIKPEHNRYLAATIPGAKLVILPNVSHFAMLQNPAAFNRAVLEFLREVRDRSGSSVNRDH
jgi:pimeloyl-ACP methyl ester carboxylesterase